MRNLAHLSENPEALAVADQCWILGILHGFSERMRVTRLRR